ncbi:MAG TPA: enoyl-CoA hydratase [Desulfotomaculum sp.]|jgi:3-hydroxybutyryl-CoA dehydratase|nr:enoyl-CoA hydratase [Desulfotomaculum sp.]
MLDKLGIKVGLKTTNMKTVTEADIVLFAGVSGDFNPVHLCEEYAEKTFFGGRIAHGALAQALLSAAMAKLPGLVIYLSQSIRFLRPIRIGDTITAIAEVIETREDKGIVKLKNTCINQKKEIVVEGEANVRIYEPPIQE